MTTIRIDQIMGIDPEMELKKRDVEKAVYSALYDKTGEEAEAAFVEREESELGKSIGFKINTE